MKSIGDNIRRIRIARGMTQLDLAMKVGYNSKQAITRIEKGDNDVSQTKLRKFAQALNVSVAELMGYNLDDEEAKDIAFASVDVIHDKDARELVRLFSHLNANRKKQIIDYALFLQQSDKEEP